MEKIVELFAALFTKLSSLSKIFSFLIVVVIVYWIDTQMGFTYHYFTERKISEIKRYTEIINAPNLDTPTRTSLIRERAKVISKERAIVSSGGKKDNSLMYHLSYSWLIIILILFVYRLLRNQAPYDSRKKIIGQSAWVIITFIIQAGLLYLITGTYNGYIQGKLFYLINTVLQILLIIATFKYIPKLSNQQQI